MHHMQSILASYKENWRVGCNFLRTPRHVLKLLPCEIEFNDIV